MRVTISILDPTDPPELAAIYAEPSDDERLRAVVDLALSRMGAAQAWLFQIHSPLSPQRVVLRVGVELSGAAVVSPDLERWCSGGDVRALSLDDPAVKALGPSAPTGPWWLIPIASPGAPPALFFVAGAGPEQKEAALFAQRVLTSALTREHRRRVRAYLWAAFEQSADPLELTDKNAVLLWVNQAWERYTGYRAEEAIGRGLAGLLRNPAEPAHDDAFYAFTMETLSHGRAWTGAMVSRSKSGERLLQEVTVTPVVTADGGELNLATRRDIQHRERREAALMQAHHEFRGVLAALPEGVAVLQNDLVYFANQALLRILDLPLEAVVGQTLESLVAPDARAGLEDPSDGPRTVPLQRPDGSVRFCEITSAGQVSFEGRPAAIIVAHDITEKRIAQEQLALADRLSAMGTLAAGVAHEINNPLSYVLGNLELLRETTLGRLPESERDALTEALEGVQRIRRIVAELKSFTRRDSEPRLEAVDASTLLTAACNIVLNEIRHRAQLVHDFEPGLAVLGEEGRLLQVFVNLLLNSAHAIPEGDGRRHEIRVASRRLPGGRVALSVEDTGRGIPAELMPRVFEPFFTTKARGLGTGLGLPISQRIIRDLEGEIRLSSAAGVGTKVTVEPSEAAPVPPRPRPRAPIVEPTAAGRILLIDDEPGVLRALTRILRDHQVRSSSSGQQALALLEADPRVDLVICDVMMPGMTGMELYEVARDRWPDLADRFIFTTGGTFTDRTTRFFEQQRRRLEKPFDPERVLAVVRDIFGTAAPPAKESE